MLNLANFIIAFGYIGVFVTIFAESGFLLGFFLPGDSLLFTVGILASQGHFNIWWLIIITIIAAIAGDSFGYYIGHTFGDKVFSKKDSLLFKQEYVDRTENFFKKYGKRAIIMARFVPVVRTFTPVMAGVGQMEYKTFFRNNVIGGVIWGAGFLGIAYFLGSKVPGIDHYLSYIIIGIIIISVIPVAIDLLRKH